MQTVYLLKNCIKCYNALIKLYNSPDLSTNIIIVDKNQARILLLDKRIKSFPFIINTLPTNIGLIPKVANVLPLGMFLTLKNNYEHSKRITTKNISNSNKISNYRTNIFRPQVYNKRTSESFTYKNNKQPIIKRVKQTDGGFNIILSK